MKSAELTGLWEKKLRQIERNKYEPRQFIDELKEMLTEIVANVKSEWGSSITIVDAVKEEAEKSKKKASKEKKASISEKKPKKKKEKKDNPDAKSVPNTEILLCPICKKGTILKGKTAYGCSEWKSGCKFRLSFEELGNDQSEEKLKVIISDRFT